MLKMMTHMQRKVGAPRRSGALLKLALATVVFWAGALPLFAQYSRDPNSNETSESTSELARENMKRVAASSAEIEAILHKDAGLLVELKSWIAKRASGTSRSSAVSTGEDEPPGNQHLIVRPSGGPPASP